MKKKFASLVALSLALTLVFGMTVSAAGSNNTVSEEQKNMNEVATANNKKASEVTKTAVVDGKEVAVSPIIVPITPATQKEATDLADALKAAGSLTLGDGKTQAKVAPGGLVAGYNLSLWDTTTWTPIKTGSVTVTFPVVGVKASFTYAVCHEKADGTWESKSVVATVADQLTCTFDGLSPVVIIELQPDAGGNKAGGAGAAAAAATTPAAADEPVAPKTGETLPIFGMMTLVCLAGAALFARKARA